MRIRRVIVMLVVAATVSILIASTAQGATQRSAPSTAQGVSKDTIEIALLVNDLDGLRSKGVSLPAKLTTQGQIEQFQMYADDRGPINGREIVFTPVRFDVTDETTFQRACIEATQDNKPFVVLNSAGWFPAMVPCITVDNRTPLFVHDPQDTRTIEQSGNRLWTIQPPSDVMAAATADLVAKEQLVRKSAKIGLLTTNDPGGVAAGDALERRLTRHGYDIVSRVVINGLAADVNLANRESTAAVETFKAMGVDTVFTGLQQSQLSGFWQDSARTNARFDSYIFDDAPNMCTLFSASRSPVETAGVPCLTASDTRALPTKDGVKQDSDFEAECRAVSDAALGAKSQPGVPAGDTTVAGVTYTEDMPYTACTMSNILFDAIERAGDGLTWEKVAKVLRSTKSVPMAYFSDGEGGFGKNKQYAATNIHLVSLNPVARNTTPSADGTFNGCPAPTSCWVPQLIDGREWFALASKS